MFKINILDLENSLYLQWGDVKYSHIVLAAIISRQSGNEHGKPAQVLRRTKIKPGNVSGQTTLVLVKVKFIKSKLIEIFYLTIIILKLIFNRLTAVGPGQGGQRRSGCIQS